MWSFPYKSSYILHLHLLYSFTCHNSFLQIKFKAEFSAALNEWQSMLWDYMYIPTHVSQQTKKDIFPRWAMTAHSLQWPATEWMTWHRTSLFSLKYRPALLPTQPPIQWVLWTPTLMTEWKLITHLRLVSRWRMYAPLPQGPVYTYVSRCLGRGKTFAIFQRLWEGNTKKIQFSNLHDGSILMWLLLLGDGTMLRLAVLPVSQRSLHLHLQGIVSTHWPLLILTVEVPGWTQTSVRN